MKGDLNFTAELADLMCFAGETATAIRMYSAYSKGGPARYLQILEDPERDALDLMFLAESLHHFTTLGRALQMPNPNGIVQACDLVLFAFSNYEIERPELGVRQAKPTFQRWGKLVDLESAKKAIGAIRDKAASSLATA